MTHYRNLTPYGYFIEPPTPTYPMTIPAANVNAGDLVSVSINRIWLRRLSDVASYMDQPDTWTGTPAEIAAARDQSRKLMQMLLEGSQAVSNIIGSIMPIVTATTPQNMLLCDGTQYLRVDYPELYAALNQELIVDPDHFLVPDLRNRFAVGTGTRPLMATGGAETHTLNRFELPIHKHVTQEHSHEIADHTHTSPAHNHEVPSFETPVQIPTGPGSGYWTWATPSESKLTSDVAVSINPASLTMTPSQLDTFDAGSEQPHNNMPPYIALAYAIVAR